MGLFSELKLAVPWGHIAAKAWGSQKGSPILCLHGWLDNANSFDRLIPLLPRDFYYVAMDFGGHGLSSHYSPGLPYYYQNFVGEIRRVSAALKWDRFSIMGHSFGGTVGGMFSCMFPEMVDKLILLDSSPFALDSNPLPRVSRMERGTPGASWKPLSGTPPVCTPPFGVTARVSQELENLLTYKRKAIEHTLLVEQAAGEPRALRPQEMLQRLLKNNSHVGEECGELLLQRGATQVPAARAHLRFHQQGAVCTRHQEAAGPHAAHQGLQSMHSRHAHPNCCTPAAWLLSPERSVAGRWPEPQSSERWDCPAVRPQWQTICVSQAVTTWPSGWAVQDGPEHSSQPPPGGATPTSVHHGLFPS
ncbi:serine hydrolase-like protein 2 isoform X5 [Myotis myotis]|uniref:serine hydrolase-like protein 2 isoform X5 n=1 Tax=Myotis myotis TaxID=51298 RepID=UPI001749D445|nr:serine hydrolase-like protein 2 isoform X5 [Myotis myotis]